MKNKMILNRVRRANIDTRYLIQDYYIPYFSALILAVGIFILPILAILNMQGYINIF